MKISSATGQLIKVDNLFARDGGGDDVALWVSDPAHQGDTPACQTTVDALYNYPTEKYRIDQWVYLERDIGSLGSMLTKVDIYDLEEFVAWAFDQGVWHDPLDCDAIWSLMLNHIIIPMVQEDIRTQHRPSITARGHGVCVDIECRPNPEAPYVPCDWQYLYENQHIIAVHTAKLREYKRQ